MTIHQFPDRSRKLSASQRAEITREARANGFIATFSTTEDGKEYADLWRAEADCAAFGIERDIARGVWVIHRPGQVVSLGHTIGSAFMGLAA
jgi:hypothetical protein